jgi:hypothetical protein
VDLCGLCVASTLAAIHDCRMTLHMSRHPIVRLTSILSLACASMAGACSGPDGAGPNMYPTQPDVSIAPGRLDVNTRCTQFSASFDELVACQRADGTLDSLGSRAVAWRVRYFVRHLEMPCDEAPTVKESYVFNAVINDLNADSDLDAEQRIAIRTAMFDGKVPCPKGQSL